MVVIILLMFQSLERNVIEYNDGPDWPAQVRVRSSLSNEVLFHVTTFRSAMLSFTGSLSDFVPSCSRDCWKMADELEALVGVVCLEGPIVKTSSKLY